MDTVRIAVFTNTPAGRASRTAIPNKNGRIRAELLRRSKRPPLGLLGLAMTVNVVVTVVKLHYRPGSDSGTSGRVCSCLVAVAMPGVPTAEVELGMVRRPPIQLTVSAVRALGVKRAFSRNPGASTNRQEGSAARTETTTGTWPEDDRLEAATSSRA